MNKKEKFTEQTTQNPAEPRKKDINRRKKEERNSDKPKKSKSK